MDPVLIDLIGAALVAAAWAAGVAAVVLFVLMRAARRFTTWRERAAPVALAAGFVAAYFAAEGMPVARPLEAWQHVPWIAMVAAVAACCGTRGRGPWSDLFGPWLEFLFLGLAVAYVSVVTRSVVWVGGVGAAIFVAAILLDGAARRVSPATFLAAVTVLATATALTIGVSGTVRIATLCGTLAGAAAACFVLARWLPAPPRRAVALVALLLAAFSLSGVLFADMPIASAVLLALAPLGACVPDAALRRVTKPWQASALRIAAVVLLAGAAVGIAVVHSPPFGE